MNGQWYQTVALAELYEEERVFPGKESKTEDGQASQSSPDTPPTEDHLFAPQIQVLGAVPD